MASKVKIWYTVFAVRLLIKFQYENKICTYIIYNYSSWLNEASFS